MKYNLLWVS